jgi:hypothetical protein
MYVYSYYYFNFNFNIFIELNTLNIILLYDYNLFTNNSKKKVRVPR